MKVADLIIFRNALCILVVFFICGCKSVELPNSRTPAEKKLASKEIINCIGDSEASVGAVYLHGMDGFQPGLLELQNQKILKSVAKKFNLRIALPRAQQLCPEEQEQICWGWDFDETEVEKVRSTIEFSSRECGLPSKKILIGFSNGAYALNKMFRLCQTTNDQIIISQGANMLSESIEKNPKNLSQCGKIIFVSGKNDIYNYDRKAKYHLKLRKKHAHAELIEFKGGHEMTEETLTRALRLGLRKNL